MNALPVITGRHVRVPARHPASRVGPVLAIGVLVSCSSTEDGIPTGPDPVVAPSTVQVEVVSHEALEVSWVDNSSTEVEFRIEREEVVGGADGTVGGGFGLVQTVGADVTSFRDMGLAAGTVYRYRVSACDSDRCSDPSAASEDRATMFWGTIFIDPDILTPSDPTAFQQMTHAGLGSRLMFDRRTGWITVEAHLFDVAFSDGLSAEVQVNPEFTLAQAQAEALKYSEVIGRLPKALRRDVQTVWIHRGVQPFGGGNYNLLIHTGQGELYIADGILEETLVHEASHTSLDADHGAASGWLAAQESDDTYISTYARDFPTREDVAETFLTYLAVRYRPDRISPALAYAITVGVPHRIEYFGSLALEMFPIQ